MKPLKKIALASLLLLALSSSLLGQSHISVGVNMLSVTASQTESQLMEPSMIMTPLNGLYANYETATGWSVRASFTTSEYVKRPFVDTYVNYGGFEQTAVAAGIGKTLTSGRRLSPYVALDLRYAKSQTSATSQGGIVPTPPTTVWDVRHHYSVSPTLGVTYALGTHLRLRLETTLHIQQSSMRQVYFSDPVQSTIPVIEKDLFSVLVAPVNILGVEYVF